MNDRLTSRAKCIVASWLDHLQIPYNKKEDRIIINHQDKDISILFDNENVIVLNPESVASPNLDIALSSIHKITEKIGIKTPSLARSQMPLSKANYKKDYESVYLRCRQLIRSPNPPEEKLKKYSHIVKKCGGAAYNKFRFLCDRMGFEKDDLINIGMVHLVGFLHEFEEGDYEETCKNLSVYLWQRYQEWGKLTSKKLKNCFSVVGEKEFVKDVETYLHSIDEENKETIILKDEEEYELSENGIDQKIKIKAQNGTLKEILLDGKKLTKKQMLVIREKLENGTLQLKERRVTNKDYKILYNNFINSTLCFKCSRFVQQPSFKSEIYRNKDGDIIQSNKKVFCSNCLSF